jgi:hypothetical protein
MYQLAFQLGSILLRVLNSNGSPDIVAQLFDEYVSIASSIPESIWASAAASPQMIDGKENAVNLWGAGEAAIRVLGPNSFQAYPMRGS